MVEYDEVHAIDAFLVSLFDEFAELDMEFRVDSRSGEDTAVENDNFAKVMIGTQNQDDSEPNRTPEYASQMMLH